MPRAAEDAGAPQGRWLVAVAALLLLGVGAVTWLLAGDRGDDGGGDRRVVQSGPGGATGAGFSGPAPPAAAVPEPPPRPPERLVPDSARLGEHHLVLAHARAETNTTTFVVLDTHGARVPDALVSVWSLARTRAAKPKQGTLPILDMDALDGLPRHRALTDPAGEVRITAPRGHDYAVAAEHLEHGTSGLLIPGRRWLRFSDVLLPRNPAQRPQVEELVLQPVARLEGRILGRGGEPLAGVRLSVAAGPVERDGNRTSPRNPGNHVTDDEGRFAFAVDAPAGVSLDAVLPGGGLLDVWARVEPGEVWSRTLYGPGAAVVSGVVVTEMGRPVEDAVVMAVAVQGAAKLGQARTDDDGRFTLDLIRDGEFDVYAFAGQRVQREVPTLIAAGDRVQAEVRITLLAGGILEGRVTLEDGRPAPPGTPPAEVLARPKVSPRSLPPELVRYLFSLRRTVRVRPDGSFKILSVHPEYDYELSTAYENIDGTWARGHATATPGAGPVELVLEGPVITWGRQRERGKRPQK